MTTIQMFSHVREVAIAADRIAHHGTINDVLTELRSLCLDDFATLFLSMPNPEFPALSRLLPRMTDAEVQKSWTGAEGYALLQGSLNFVRSMVLQCVALTGRPLQGESILDFGCGYGRIIRLMYYYSEPSRIWGVDPWDRAIDLCRSDGMLGNFALSDYLPKDLPVSSTRFGLIYAFSVFTHLSERATRQALATLRNYVNDNGLCVITIRPREYWDMAAAGGNPVDCNLMKQQHDGRGFAFTPLNLPPIDGDITYGDTSMTFRWLAENIPEWKIASHDHTLDDPLQVIVYLRPRPAKRGWERPASPTFCAGPRRGKP